MTKNGSDENLDVNNVYGKHIDLYIHLDKLRWTFTVGIFIVGGTLLNFACFFKDKVYFLFLLGLVCWIYGFITKKYQKTIEKFGKGQDFICLLLSNIEKKNEHVFNKTIESPHEDEGHISFYHRRSRSIIKTVNNSGKKEKQSIRQIQIYDNILNKMSIIFKFLGCLLILLNILLLAV